MKTTISFCFITISLFFGFGDYFTYGQKTKNEIPFQQNSDWEKLEIPEGFYPITAAFGENGEIVLIGNEIRFSKDNGKTWKIIAEGKGFDRCTIDGGKTFEKGCETESGKPKKIKFDGDVNYIGDVRNPVITPDGRLYLSTFYEHHGALWSIPLENPDEDWFGLRFTYNGDPSDMKYWTTDNFITLKNKVFVSASSSQDKTYNWLTTDDKGKTWNQIKFNLVSDKYFIDENQGLKIKDNQIEKTTNAGRTRQIVHSPKIPDSTLSDYFIDDKTGFACGKNGLLFITKNGGNSWKKIDLGIRETLYNVVALDEKNAWTGGEKDIFETIDGGQNWKKVDLDFGKDGYSSLGEEKIKVDRFHRTVWIINGRQVFRKSVK